MKVISESVIKSNTGKAFAVKKGQIIRVIGESTADYVVFNLRNVKDLRNKGRRTYLEVQQCDDDHRQGYL